VLVNNPWLEACTRNLDALDHILLVGTGLTAIDVALSLDKAGYGGRITALSRRGLGPRAHAQSGPSVEPAPRPSARGSWLIRHLRQRSAQVDWRQAIDELRPHTQNLWRQHDEAAQARFCAMPGHGGMCIAIVWPLPWRIGLRGWRARAACVLSPGALPMPCRKSMARTFIGARVGRSIWNSLMLGASSCAPGRRAIWRVVSIPC
jgi:hypothetical protein